MSTAAPRRVRRETPGRHKTRRRREPGRGCAPWKVKSNAAREYNGPRPAAAQSTGACSGALSGTGEPGHCCMRETFASVIAANRFGLGARPGELALIGGDAREWLRAQLRAPPPVLAADLRPSSQILAGARVAARES